MQFELVLHWLPKEDRWALVRWDDWVKFLGIGQPQKVGLPRVNGGVHYFLVCVLDDYGAPANLIPHKYFINPDGTPRADNFGGATKEERETYGTLFLKRERTPEEEKLFNQLAEKMWGRVMFPPAESVYALLRILPKRPVPDSLAARFIRELILQTP